MEKAVTCSQCRYYGKSTCCNESSINYGNCIRYDEAFKTTCDGTHGRDKNMTLHEAMRRITFNKEYMTNGVMIDHMTPKSDHEPSITIYFTSNDALEDWRDASGRISEEIFTGKYITDLESVALMIRSMKAETIHKEEISKDDFDKYVNKILEKLEGKRYPRPVGQRKREFNGMLRNETW